MARPRTPVGAVLEALLAMVAVGCVFVWTFWPNHGIPMAFIALVLAALFGVIALASFAGGEPFLGVMGAIGCLMVLWVGGLTLFKGR